MIQRTRKFAVNVLRTGQRELAGTLGKSGLKHPDKLSGIAYDITADGYIVLREALSWVACEVHQTMKTGDSTLVVAEVVDAGIIAEGQPLSMAEAGFRHAG
jgi:flavin reductase (DIM6/NTAB) family NADH-FMN oxidoreductase RutF